MQKKWMVIDHNNNVLAGPYIGPIEAAKKADELSKEISGLKPGIIESDHLQRIQTIYVNDVLTTRSIFDSPRKD